jgi:hypothetical protein
MIEVVCDPGSRYTKFAAARPGDDAPVTLLLPSVEADDLARLARRAAAALSPGFFEKVRLHMAGDGSAPRRSGASPLLLGRALAHATSALGGPVLVADCGGLRTRVFEVAGGALQRTHENERCTAGGGRFVETMSGALHVGLEEIDACVARSASPCRVSSPCMVFAESEMISQVNGGVPREDVLAGVVAHAVEKVATLVERARPAGRPLVAVGGLARLAAFRDGLAAALPAVRVIASPVDPLFFNCLAGLALARGAPLSGWQQAAGRGDSDCDAA